MALNGLHCAYVPLRNYSLTHSLATPSITLCCKLQPFLDLVLYLGPRSFRCGVISLYCLCDHTHTHTHTDRQTHTFNFRINDYSQTNHSRRQGTPYLWSLQPWYWFLLYYLSSVTTDYYIRCKIRNEYKTYCLSSRICKISRNIVDHNGTHHFTKKISIF